MALPLVSASSRQLEFVLLDSSSENRERLREAWTRVVNQLENPGYYHRFEWYECYVTALESAPKSIFFAIAYRKREAVGVFPLRLTRTRIGGVPVHVLEIPASPQMLLGDFIFRICRENAGFVRQLLEFLRTQKKLRWDVLKISNTLEGSAALFSIRTDRPPRCVQDDEPGCHFVVCRDFRASSKVKNKLNRLARIGPIEYVHARDPRSVAAAIDEFIDVEASGWKGLEGTAIRCRPRELAFYRDVAARFSMTGATQLSLLRVGNKCIAGSYMLRTGRTLYWLKHGFDEEFAKTSPGQLLFTHLVEDCLERGDVDEINFITNNEWHTIFSPHELSKWTTFAFRANLPGLLSYAALRSKNVVRRVRAKNWLWPRTSSRTALMTDLARVAQH